MDFEKIVNPIVKDIPPSGIRKFFDLANQMEGVISLGVGEPDFATPWTIREAAIYSIEKGKTFYTANQGLLELRKEICKYQKRRFNLDYKPEQCIVTVGGSEGIDLAFRTIINPGDEVILLQPSYVAYTPGVALAGGVVRNITLTEENEFKLTPELLKEAINEKTKAILLNYPSNPTGGFMTREDYEKLVPIFKESGIMIITDEIYAELSYEHEFCSIAAFDEIKDQVILVSGFSKAYAMTGWRMGYIASSQENIDRILKVHQYTTTSQMTFAQIGMAKAIDQEDVKEEVQHMIHTFHERRTFIMEQLDQCESLSYIKPHGAFYIMVDVSKTGFNGQEFADKLLDYGVAVVPASGFGKGLNNFIRISFASSKENIEEAFIRIRKMLVDINR